MIESSLKLNDFLVSHPHIKNLIEKHYLELTKDERNLVFQYLELKKLEEYHKKVSQLK